MKTRRTLLFGCITAMVLITVLATWWLVNRNYGQVEIELARHAEDALIEQIVNFAPSATTKGRAIGAPLPKNRKVPPPSMPRNPNATFNPDRYSLVTVERPMQRVAAAPHTNGPSRDSIDNAIANHWLRSDSAIPDLMTQAKTMGRNWTYGWVQIERPMKSETIRSEFKVHGAEMLGSSGQMVRVRVPANLEQIAAIDELHWVSGIGALPPALKPSPELALKAQQSTPSVQIPVFITVMDDSSEGTFRNDLEALAVAIGPFDQDIRSFAAVIEPSQLFTIAQLDYVQAIETIEIVSVSHDTAVQTMGVDTLRTIGQSFGLYSGLTGTSTPIAVMDTGLNSRHVAISTNRKSICAENFIDNEDSDLWIDNHGHGTHVTGTVAGNGYYMPLFAGMAPNVEHIRFAKVLSSSGFGSTFGITRAMDFLGTPSSCMYNGSESDAVKALVVNMSLSSSSLFNESRDTGARKLDSAVWNYKQLYVVSNANSNTSGFSNYAAAKNSLAIGSVRDSGDIASSSSHGPTADGRLNPSVMGTGVDVWSAQGNGSIDTYRSASGTSMASPSVAGVAALLMDASPDHREQPALVRARLMASAIKPDSWFGSPKVFPKDNSNGPGSIQAEYGMGLVSARTSILNDDVPKGWTNSGVTVELEDGEYGYHDIEIPAGTSRLDIVMTWDEPATDTITDSVLNDLNLWVDFQADCDSGPCGEYSSRSSIDNVEWVVVQDPEPGTYRVKIDAHRVYTDAPRAAVAWTIIRGSSSPVLAIQSNKEVFETPDGEYHEHVVELSVSSNSYVSSATRLHMDCRTLDGSTCGTIGYKHHDGTVYSRRLAGVIQREDGLGVEIAGDTFLPLGEIAHGETQNVLVDLATYIREPIRIYFTVGSWNGYADSTSVVFRPAGSSESPAQVAHSSNDNYETPNILEGHRGNLDIDPIGSSAEGGEPGIGFSDVRPAGSVWFKWVPEDSGRASFLVTPSIDNPEFLRSYQPNIEIFRSDGGLLGSTRIGSSSWSVQFFVREDEEYRVRVSHNTASMPLTLHWLMGERPANDNFANALVLLGSEGAVAGNNLGATLEPGELYGQLASTVWYRWTAPDDGTWQFQLEDVQTGNILAFVGEDVSDLRLVSTVAAPGLPIRFEAREGQTYRIMVAAQDAYSGGSNFDSLAWKQVADRRESNDMFDGASTLDGSESGSNFVSVAASASVEPDEPKESGIQTQWWKWQAPSDGLYTWYWTGDTTVVRAFTGETLDSLQPVSVVDGVAYKREFVVDATSGEEFWFSIGRPSKETLAFLPGSSTRTGLYWGETPDNNTLSQAQILDSHIGQANLSGQYATTEPDGRTHLGLSSLWYTREVTQTGWVRFWIEGSSVSFRLTAYVQSVDGNELQLAMSSRIPGFFDDFPIEVYVYAEAGSTIVVRVGNSSAHNTASSVLRWDRSEAPNWLRFLGRIAHNRRDSGGNILTLRNPRDLTLNSDGSGLFVASDFGLEVFRRDVDSGDLTYIRTYDDVHPQSYLVWDSHRSRLYANHLDTWWTFAPELDSSVDLELLSVDYGLGATTRRNFNGSPSLFLGKEGNYLYRTLDGEQSIFSFDSDGRLIHYGDFRVAPPAVYQSNDQNHWFGIDGNYITLDQRIVGSPFYENLHEPEYIGGGGWTAAASYTGEHVVVADEYGIEAVAYAVNKESGSLNQESSEFFFGLGLDDCWNALPRSNSHSVDIICDTGGYVIEYVPDDDEFTLLDNFVNSGFFYQTPDRWGNLPPSYTLTENVSIAPSPDGRHLYASTVEHGVLIFERVGNELAESEDDPTTPAKRLDLIQAAPNRIEFGEDSAEGGCLEAPSWEIDGTTYGVFWSKWQERELGFDWTDIEGTQVNLQLCSYDPSEDKEYRMVTSLAIDGAIGEYTSNYFAELNYETLASLVVASSEITLNESTFTECTTISGMEINEVTYSVASSKWQVREDADSRWTDIPGTHTAGGFCPYDPSDDRDYRLVGRMVINDERSFRTSNILNESAEN